MSKCAIIMAGGKGTRMKTDLPKVMCEVLFEPMISHVIKAVKNAGCESICVITGHKREVVEAALPAEVSVEPAVAERRGRNHRIRTDTGIEITFPSEYCDNRDYIEFVNNPNGLISIELKNIGKITNR